MRATLTSILAFAVLAVVASPALAGDFNFGHGFSIGGAHFRIGYHEHRHDYYYRTDHQLHYRGYRCTDRCYVQRRTHFHHTSCPVVQHHLVRYGYDPNGVFRSYAPYRQSHGRYEYERRYYRSPYAYPYPYPYAYPPPGYYYPPPPYRYR